MIVTVTWHNDTDMELTYGQYFTLHKLIDGKWFVVEKQTDVNYAFTDEGLKLPAGETCEHAYNLIPYTDGLDAGEYRISAYTFEEYPECYQVYGYFGVK